MGAPGTLGHVFEALRNMLDRLVARIPALLMLGLLACAGHVVVREADQPARLVALVPTLLLFVAYLRSGRRQSGGHRL